MFGWIRTTSLRNKCVKHCFLSKCSVCRCLNRCDNFVSDKDMLLCGVLCEREYWLFCNCAKHLFEVVVSWKICNRQCNRCCNCMRDMRNLCYGCCWRFYCRYKRSTIFTLHNIVCNTNCPNTKQDIEEYRHGRTCIETSVWYVCKRHTIN